MDNQTLPLCRAYPRRIEVPLMLIAALVTLILGLSLPVLSLRELFVFKSTFSVITGIQGLWKDGQQLLAVLIFFFSVIFPFFKLIVLTTVWFSRVSYRRRKILLHWLGMLGKWSMLDVFVVAVTIVITKISKLAKAEPRVGIYFFAASIILAMLATERIQRLIQRLRRPQIEPAEVPSPVQKRFNHN